VLGKLGAAARNSRLGDYGAQIVCRRPHVLGLRAGEPSYLAVALEAQSGAIEGRFGDAARERL
jgi:hypothetical protein